jgi:hypothetical protein
MIRSVLRLMFPPTNCGVRSALSPNLVGHIHDADHLSAIVACFVLWQEICHPAFSDFCNKIGAEREVTRAANREAQEGQFR